MKKKIILSILVILFVAAASLGATMAWFTSSVTLDNTFTAGTLIIGGEDTWESLDGDDWENVNPGDCKGKEFTITNEGTKNALLRFKFDGSWGEWENDMWAEMADSDPDLVTISFNEPSDWYLHTDGWYYYLDRMLPADDIDYEDLEFALKVCVDGPGTGNEYQGISYKLDFTFQAIQASNNASGGLVADGGWDVDSWYYLNAVPVAPDTANLDRSADNWAGFEFQYLP